MSNKKEANKASKAAKLIKKLKKPTVQEKPKFVLFTKNNEPVATKNKGNTLKLE